MKAFQRRAVLIGDLFIGRADPGTNWPTSPEQEAANRWRHGCDHVCRPPREGTYQRVGGELGDNLFGGGASLGFFCAWLLREEPLSSSLVLSTSFSWVVFPSCSRELMLKKSSTAPIPPSPSTSSLRVEHGLIWIEALVVRCFGGRWWTLGLGGPFLLWSGLSSCRFASTSRRRGERYLTKRCAAAVGICFKSLSSFTVWHSHRLFTYENFIWVVYSSYV